MSRPISILSLDPDLQQELEAMIKSSKAKGVSPNTVQRLWRAKEALAAVELEKSL